MRVSFALKTLLDGTLKKQHPTVQTHWQSDTLEIQYPFRMGTKWFSTTLQLLLRQEPKVKVDQKDTEGMSALMYAAETGHYHAAWLTWLT